MEREIKFRIYDKNKKEYLDEQDYQISCDDGVIYEAVPIFLKSEASCGLKTAYGLIAEQYTGLKDKNGVDIYEGDKVSIDMNFYHIEAKVEYRDDLGTFVFDYPKGVRTVIVDCIRNEHIEVIGNIHDKEEE